MGYRGWQVAHPKQARHKTVKQKTRQFKKETFKQHESATASGKPQPLWLKSNPVHFSSFSNRALMGIPLNSSIAIFLSYNRNIGSVEIQWLVKIIWKVSSTSKHICNGFNFRRIKIDRLVESACIVEHLVHVVDIGGVKIDHFSALSLLC